MEGDFFLENLMTQRPVRRLGVPSVNSAQEIEHLSVVAPQITELRDIVTTGQNPEIPNSEWHRLFSLFPLLEVIEIWPFVWFYPLVENLTIESAEKNNTQIQALAKACPRLRLVLVARHAKKAVIIRGRGGEEPRAKAEGVRWVVRKWMESEEVAVRSWENVYGP